MKTLSEDWRDKADVYRSFCSTAGRMIVDVLELCARQYDDERRQLLKPQCAECGSEEIDAMTRNGLDKYTVAVSPLDGEIYLVRPSKRDPRLALDRRKATKEVIFAACRHLLHDAEEGAFLHMTIGKEKYTLSICRGWEE